MTLTPHFSRVQAVVVELTQEQRSEARDAVVSAYENCGADPDYGCMASTIAMTIMYSRRPESEEVMKAIYDEAIRILDVDLRPKYD